MSDFLATSQPAPETVAAIDLGSNSFHMIVARVSDGHLQVIDKLREMVRLGEGLTEDKGLRPEVAERALACLERFGQRARPLPPGSVRTVGTNTLRQISPANSFLAAAEAALGHPIEVIAGREEARLIYLGVAHGLAASDERRLVVDIGGGSTELIIGEGFTPRLRESLHMGCVSMSQRYFPDGQITEKAMARAELAGALEIRPIREIFRDAQWRLAVGSSGTIRAIRAVVRSEGWSEEGITFKSLDTLRNALIKAGHFDAIELKGLDSERKPVFAGGVAVLLAIFRSLEIDQMRVSDEALREGLLYEMLGRIQHEDTRDRTVRFLSRRYSVDSAHANRIQVTALNLYGQVAEAWELSNPQYSVMLGWAARLLEIGLTVSHSQYHKHGAYLVQNSDLSGFSRQEQAVLAALVYGHRRKFPSAVFEALPKPVVTCGKRLCLLLRLAVLLHRSRSAATKPPVILDVDGDIMQLSFSDNWLSHHPLTRMELELEDQWLQASGFKLTFD